jgi:Uma2 family endonuclease
MTAVKRFEPISVEDYLAGERIAKRKQEYTGGYIYMMAGGRNVHNRIAVAFVSAMHVRLRGKRCEAYNSNTKVRVRMSTHTRFYYPDGMVVCESNPDNDEFQDRPVVIAEVLSPSTRRIDEGEKRDAYLTIPTLDAYLLIECVCPRVVVHCRTSSGFVPQVFEGLDAAIPLETIGLELPLAELYERVDFAAAEREADEEREEFGIPG